MTHPHTEQAAPAPARAQEFFGSLLSQPLPDALDAWRYRIRSADRDPAAEPVSGFERYALRTLDAARDDRLRPIYAHHRVTLGRLATTGLFWVGYTASHVSDDESETLLAIEATLNRLVLAWRALDAAHLSAAPTEGLCSQEDWASLRRIVDQAEGLMAHVLIDNPLDGFHGIPAKRGREWDVRSRFAWAAEHLVLPYRTDYRFDCDVEEGVMCVDFATPRASAMPATRWRSEGGWEDRSLLRPAAASAYALRAAALYAACAFGANLGIESVVVCAHDATSTGEEILSVRFSRASFLASTMQTIEDGRLTSASLTSATQVLDLVSPTETRIALGAYGGLSKIEPLVARLSPQPPVAYDSRLLPAEAASLLHADTVLELDVMSPRDEDLLARVEEARDDARDSQLLAIAQLEDVVAACLDRQKLPGEGELALYCSGVVERYLVSLVHPEPSLRYVRASDALFAARIDLARLHRAMGDYDRALAQATAALEIAPTSTLAYLEVATTLGAAGRAREAVDVLRRGIDVCYLADTLSFLHYRLAFLLWSAGDSASAMAAYVLSRDNPQVGEMARHELATLMAEEGVAEEPSSDAAVSQLSSIQVRCEVNPAIADAMAAIALSLTDAGLTCAARPALMLLSTLDRNDVIGSVAASLHARD